MKEIVESDLKTISELKYSFRRAKSGVEDIFIYIYYLAKYKYLGENQTDWVKSVAARSIKNRPNVNLTIHRFKEGKYTYRVQEDQSVEPHTMPHYVARRVLNAIPANEIEGKIFYDIFGGHGAISFLLASGWKGALPSQIITSDLGYNPITDKKHIRPHNDWFYWTQKLKPNWNQADEKIHAPQPLASNSKKIPLPENSVDIAFGDPPFGFLTEVNEVPEQIFNETIPEIIRVLKKGGSAYCLFPAELMSRLKYPEDVSVELISKNVGRTWFDISLFKITKI